MINEFLNPETGAPGGVVYRGYRLYLNGGGTLVVIEVGGELVGLLPHQIKHSPTGLMWGYDGAGPADLARSLLIHALGDAAGCPVCDGTGEVVYDDLTDAKVPARHAVNSPSGTPMPCADCENGWTITSSTYQRFKTEVVADLPESRWNLSRIEVLAWFDKHVRENAGVASAVTDRADSPRCDG